MNEAAIPAATAEGGVATARTAGVIAIAYAASQIVQNALFAGAPNYGDAPDIVLTYHAQHQGALAATSGLEAVNMLLLLLFVTALHGLVQRRGGIGADWSRFAVAAGSTLAALSALTIVTHMAVILAAKGQTAPTPAFELLWQLHAAAFALSLPALGATFIGAALATHASGLTPGWQRLLGVAGGSLPILAGLGSLGIADGSPLLFVGVLGLALWLVWLIATGLRLIRGEGRHRLRQQAFA